MPRLHALAAQPQRWLCGLLWQEHSLLRCFFASAPGGRHDSPQPGGAYGGRSGGCAAINGCWPTILACTTARAVRLSGTAQRRAALLQDAAPARSASCLEHLSHRCSLHVAPTHKSATENGSGAPPPARHRLHVRLEKCLGRMWRPRRLARSTVLASCLLPSLLPFRSRSHSILAATSPPLRSRGVLPVRIPRRNCTVATVAALCRPRLWSPLLSGRHCLVVALPHGFSNSRSAHTAYCRQGPLPGRYLIVGLPAIAPALGPDAWPPDAEPPFFSPTPCGIRTRRAPDFGCFGAGRLSHLMCRGRPV